MIVAFAVYLAKSSSWSWFRVFRYISGFNSNNWDFIIYCTSTWKKKLNKNKTIHVICNCYFINSTVFCQVNQALGVVNNDVKLLLQWWRKKNPKFLFWGTYCTYEISTSSIPNTDPLCSPHHAVLRFEIWCTLNPWHSLPLVYVYGHAFLFRSFCGQTPTQCMSVFVWISDLLLTYTLLSLAAL